MPFARLDHRNQEVIELALKIGRTPSALAMKACNFASFDPKLKERGVRGLPNSAKADRLLWEEFQADSVSVALQCENAYSAIAHTAHLDIEDEILEAPLGPSEVERRVKVRCIQSFFRAAVLSSYDFKCAISGMSLPSLLIASHIMPWSTFEKRRADPQNGIALNAIYDRAFDRGFLTFDEDYRVLLSPELKSADACQFQREVFYAVEGKQLALPARFAPDPVALAYHREQIFMKRKSA
jgi:predicted restriction endonuclease